MLVITRRPGDRIYLGEDVMVEVKSVAGNQVKLAIRAPRSMPVVRGEKSDIPAIDECDRIPQLGGLGVEV